MKKIAVMAFLISVSVLNLSAAVSANSGAVLFDKKCSSCHIKTKPTPEIRKNMVAPPIMGVMFHVKEKYSNKEDAVKFIVDYVLNPSQDKALCLPKSIKRFGLMPSQKGNVTEKELKEIAEYLYDNFPPKGYKHPQMMGKGKGMGMGMGMGR